MRLRVARDAEEELAEAAEWAEAKRNGLGVELVAVVDGALDAIVTAPLAHPLWGPDRPCRMKVLLQFPYVRNAERIGVLGPARTWGRTSSPGARHRRNDESDCGVARTRSVPYAAPAIARAPFFLRIRHDLDSRCPGLRNELVVNETSARPDGRP